MKKIRLFYEKWKWYFVNAYFIIGIAIIIHLCMVFCDGKPEQNPIIEEPKSSATVEEVVDVEEDEPVVKEEQEQTNEEIIEHEEQIEEMIKSAILVNKSSKVDNASSAILAFARNSEVILVDKELSQETIEKIFSFSKDENYEVFVIGGEYVITSKRLTDLSDKPNITTHRLAGDNMEKTALSVIDFISDEIDFDEAYVANFGDKESCDLVASLSKQNGIPIFPVDYSGISDEVLEAIAKYGVKKITIVGSGVGSYIESQLAGVVGAENITR